MKNTHFDNYERAWKLLKGIGIVPNGFGVDLFIAPNLERHDKSLAIQFGRYIREPQVFQDTLGAFLNRQDKYTVNKHQLKLVMDGMSVMSERTKKNDMWSGIVHSWKKWRSRNFRYDILEMQKLWKEELRVFKVWSEASTLILHAIIKSKDAILEQTKGECDMDILGELLFLDKNLEMSLTSAERAKSRIDSYIISLSSHLKNCETLLLENK